MRIGTAGTLSLLAFAGCARDSVDARSTPAAYIGRWTGPMDDGARYTMMLHPEGAGALTVIEPSPEERARRTPRASDTLHFVSWGYDDPESDVSRDSSAARLCLFQESGESRCHGVWTLRGDTLDMVEHGGQSLRLIRARSAR